MEFVEELIEDVEDPLELSFSSVKDFSVLLQSVRSIVLFGSFAVVDVLVGGSCPALIAGGGFSWPSLSC
jgi:hypothetical protein